MTEAARAGLGHDRLDVDGNLMLIIINLPLVGMWGVRLLRVPYRLMYPIDRHLLCNRHVLGQQRAGRRAMPRSSVWSATGW